MELRALVDLMVGAGSFADLINDPFSQFGTGIRQYLMAQFLPEQNRSRNEYRETYIEFRSNIANASTRYSPPQIKGNSLVGSWLVELAESDIAAEFTSQDYDALIEMIQDLPDVSTISDVPMEAIVKMTNWFDTGIVRPLNEFNEKNRCDAIVNSVVLLKGDNNFNETVNYYNPPGHRVNAGGDWTSSTYDPLPDLTTGCNKLIAKGYPPTNIITSQEVLVALLNNAKMLARAGLLSIIGGVIVGLPQAMSVDQLNGVLKQNKVPSIVTYDLQYRTQLGTDWFFPRDALVILGNTGRDKQYDRGDNQPFNLPNLLGYTGVGRPANRNTQGRATVVEYNDKKGAPVKAQGWQTSLPVIDNPEAIYVIRNITYAAISTGTAAQYT